jgi:hypothetical protein
MSEIEIAVQYAKEIEGLLEELYLATGKGQTPALTEVKTEGRAKAGG